MSSLYAMKIDRGLSEPAFDALLEFCGPARASALRRFVRRDDRIRGLCSTLLVRGLVCRDLGLANHEVRFGTDVRGKPVLLDHPQYHFNTAHAGDWVVAATDGEPVGIDIEKIRPLDLHVARTFFSPAEVAALEAEPESERLDRFYTLWVLKEAFLKATGEGLRRDLASFTVTLAGDDARVATPPGETRWYLKLLFVAPGYRAALCGSHPRFPEKVRHLGIQEVLSALGPEASSPVLPGAH